MPKKIINYKCPFCNKKYNRNNLVRHVENKHDEMIPENFTALRLIFNYINKKPQDYHGKCTECGRATPWDENKARYNRQCNDPACKASFIKKFEDNMIKRHGVSRISSTTEGLEKMLANRKISGKYKFKNGKEKTYTGSYEKKALEFMDQVLNINPDDILAPGPTLEYIYDNKKHIYITDFYYQPYNLIIEVKDGGKKPNNRNMPEYRAKQIAKEEYIIKNTSYNYLRLTDNDFSQLLSVFMDLKMELVENTLKRVIHINESMNALMSGYIPGIKDTGNVYIVNYMTNNVFSGEEERGYGIADSPLLNNFICRDKEGRLRKAPKEFIERCRYNIYLSDKSIKEVSKLLSPYMGEFVEEGFIYEKLFDKPFFSYDQIGLEPLLTLIPDYFYSLKKLQEVTKNFIKSEHDNGNLVNINNSNENKFICYENLDIKEKRFRLKSVEFPDLYLESDNYMDDKSDEKRFLESLLMEVKSSMDQNNVLEITNSLEELQEDINKWASLPYFDRKESDKICKEQYGCTNYELFNKVRNRLLSTYFEENMSLGSFKESVLNEDNELELIPNFDSTNEKSTFAMKKELSEELNKDINIVIIIPYKDEQNEYGLETLYSTLKRYSALDENGKRMSNAYSFKIWGYNVLEMYSLMKRFLTGEKDCYEQPLTDKEINDMMTESFVPVENLVNNMILENDRLSMLRFKYDALSVNNPLDKVRYDTAVNEIDKSLVGNFESSLPDTVPYFTIDEMYDMESKGTHIKINECENWFGSLVEACKNFKLNPNAETVNEILSLGWNPAIELNEYNMKMAKSRQAKWLQENASHIVDISTLYNLSENVLTEASTKMTNIYRENELFPLFIVLSYTETALGKYAIRPITKSRWTHSGISTDSSLKRILSFNFNIPQKVDGFTDKKESIDVYLKITPKAQIAVYCLFVDKPTKNRFSYAVGEFTKKMKDTHYGGFMGLFNVLINKAKKDDPNRLSMICSEFVDTILKMINIDLTGKTSNLVSPADFEKAGNANPKVYKIFDGYAQDYNSTKVDKIIENLLKSKERDQILFKSSEKLRTKNTKYYTGDAEKLNVPDTYKDKNKDDDNDKSNDKKIKESFNFNHEVTDNEQANKIMKEMLNLMTPEPVIAERGFPFHFNNKGDLSIDTYKSFEDQYQESHKLLVNYNENNIDGIKHELAKLFYINSAIEKKIKKMKKGDKSYKELIDLRARILNDFKKYFKVVVDNDPEFDFNFYFQNSEYYNGNFVIDNSILKFSGEAIKSFLSNIKLL